MLRLLLNNKALETIEKALFVLFIFALPFGTRKFIFSELPGNNFFTAFIYLSDFLLVLILLMWLRRRGFKGFFLQYKKFVVWNLIFLLILLVSLLLNYNVLSLYYFLRIAAGILFIFYICSAFKLYNKELLLKIFIFSVVVQSLIAIGQFLLQSDLGLKLLGEPKLAPQIAGIAKVNVDFGKFIRPYGTLPHPNVLGAFLIAGIAALTYKMFFLKRSSLDYLFLALIAAALFLSFSRAAYLAFIVFVLFFSLYFIKFHRDKLQKLFIFIFLLLAVVVCFGILFKPFLFKRVDIKNDAALQLRFFYNAAAVNMIKDNILFGVGIGNFSREINNYLPEDQKLKNFWEFQPSHNVFLLIGAEGGFLAMILFVFFLLYFIYFLLRRASNNRNALSTILAFILISFIVLMLFDHYFLTQWQAFILLCITLGIICAFSPYRKSEI